MPRGPGRHSLTEALLGATSLLHLTLQNTYHSGSLSTMEAARERGKWAILGEGGVPAGLELAVVGGCRFSHCTIGGRGWLGLRIHVKDSINTINTHNNNSTIVQAQVPGHQHSCVYSTGDTVLSVPSQNYKASHSRKSHILNYRHITELFCLWVI